MLNQKVRASKLFVENCLTLTGNVVTGVKQNLSPAKIPTYSFYLEHRSNRTEVNLQRQVWCKIKVVLAGEQFSTQTKHITVGCKVRIKGFIHTHKDYNGLNQLVLHTEQIEFID
ncbi:primosomal replication protein N [Pasteurella atlantica]|uniref:Primosomal replication protein N n=2 Tax=Pasteurellaceae TaxID=712 RepID=A0ACC6HMQ5_9PAST|nr:primosomal replication protein N [Pasteurella atlantica]MDP8034216.1 primosomal replication protein N [Pasteurella atlantica]MDP8036121.1 primosomal replication protein N [Pasteurella atlantica]MDP8038071.1 primosomal replication protein N [Pasteurella atlantica]MDP8048426.1 primosomal replication protein N [Pasteurella atlantica]MDP8050383.1 primosomal replication protein N [Pasteurella atlantica]